MKPLQVRFHGALNDFLPLERRGVDFPFSPRSVGSVKDLIESLGPPHPEVDVVCVDGEAVDASHRPTEGQRLDVYPARFPLEPPPAVRWSPPPLDEPRFLLDVGLGRLAGLLRMLGFDTLWRNDWADDVLARRSRDERRILLTRDYGVLKRAEVEYGYFPRETDPPRQLREVVRHCQLLPRVRPFTRCIACNAGLADASLDEVRDRVPERIQATFTRFQHCGGCGRVYWAGSHHTRMEALIARLHADEST